MKKFILILVCFIPLIFPGKEHSNTKIRIEEKNVILLRIEKKNIDTLASSSAFPFSFRHIYSFNSDSSNLAYVKDKGEEFKIMILTGKMTEPVGVECKGTIDGRTKLRWSPDDTLLVFNAGEKIWLYNFNSDTTMKLTNPEKGLEDFDPGFSKEGDKIYFYRGNRFEFNFSGEKYSIKPDGTGIKKEKEKKRKYKGEDLRGGQFE